MLIDLHAHYAPRSFLEAIEKEGGPYGASVRRDGRDLTMVVGGRPYGPITRHYFETRPRIAEMDKLRVDMQVLSLCPPMVYWADSRLGTRLSRAFNDELAAALAERPDRLAGLATVPLQDVAESIAELERAMEGLGMSGVLDRFPRLQVCLAHAGGALPYLIGRLDRVFRVRGEARGKARRRPSGYLRRFHYDTVVHHELALRYLVDLVGKDRVVVGSDYRFDMGCLDPRRAVAAVRQLSRADRTAILGGAAARR